MHKPGTHHAKSPKSAKPSKSAKSSMLDIHIQQTEISEPTYLATDEDLPIELFEAPVDSEQALRTVETVMGVN
jgi:hypothetical protein